MPDLLQDIAVVTLIGDKAIDSDALLDTLAKRGAEIDSAVRCKIVKGKGNEHEYTYPPPLDFGDWP